MAAAKPYDPNFIGPVLDPSMIGKMNPMGQLMSAPQAKPHEQQQQDPMAMIGQILTALMGNAQDPLARGKNNAATITALRNDPQGDANKAYRPGVMPGQPGAEANPFTNGFFKTGDQRHVVEASRGPIPWADPATPMPFSDFGTPTHSTPYVPPPDFGTPPPNGTPAAGNWMDNVEQTNQAMYAPGGFMQLLTEQLKPKVRPTTTARGSSSFLPALR